MSRPSLRGGYLEAEARGSNRSKGTEKKRYANTQYPPHRWGAEQWVGANCGAERGAARRTDLEGPGERPRWARGGTLGRCPSTEAKENVTYLGESADVGESTQKPVRSGFG